MKNLVTLCRDSSDKILDAIELTKILEEIVEDDAKIYSLIKIIKSNIKIAFDNIEECRSMIYFFD